MGCQGKKGVQDDSKIFVGSMKESPILRLRKLGHTEVRGPHPRPEHQPTEHRPPCSSLQRKGWRGAQPHQVGSLTLRLPAGAAEAHPQGGPSGRLQVRGEGTPGNRRGAGALPVRTPRPQPGTGVRDSLKPEPHQHRTAPVAARHTLQSPAAGPRLALHPGWSWAQLRWPQGPGTRTPMGKTPTGALGLTEHLGERLPFGLSTWAPFHFLLSVGLCTHSSTQAAMFRLSSLSGSSSCPETNVTTSKWVLFLTQNFPATFIQSTPHSLWLWIAVST